MQSLTLAQAQKLALLSQGLPTAGVKGSGYAKTLNTFEQLGYIQIDTISVVQRAHHHTLWSRNPGYQPKHLDQLVADRQVFEYWSHAAAYLPMSNYRYSLPRKVAIKSGQQRHWYCKDRDLMKNVLARIEAEGPLMAKDFESKAHKTDGWHTKPTKQALENLYMQGDLMIAKRRGFHKVYDLTQRVLPQNIDTSMPTPQEHGRFLVLSYLKAHGFGTIQEMVYQLKDVKTSVTQAIGELVEMGEIEPIMVNHQPYYACVKSLNLLGKRLNRKQARILSPFDNLLIQRKRASAIFNFDYLIECYVPEAKRQFGYFSLPILWDGKLVARADCKVDKKSATLNVLHLSLEPGLTNTDDFMPALEKELQAFARFNQCEQFNIVKQSINVG
ncbi:winged helix DNA-binding domain-containing protein [Vibrio sp. MarTm2]|uniref:winged helix-turn-helix domain-containing protein n=1 Tax=Vibrio sp. MarTm2 TaxID=2998831 RepID=UPI0022CDADE0|nr:crosslink repair DNA glycosylase YcaQ family protein [Vibrio sp. MarTm2]MDA0128133.1 winged helix DNA-binding domain-containing protein [Vibrio sp. MarTm2]